MKISKKTKSAAVRKPRVQPEQKNYLVDFMSNHREFAAGKFSGARGAEIAKQMWQEVAAEANKRGPEKTVNEWKKTWKDLKGRSRGKVTAIRSEWAKTGNFPNDMEPLTETDRKVLSVIGSAAVEGLSGVPDSMPSSIAALRQLMAGNNAPLFEKPEDEFSVFEALDIEVPVTNKICEEYTEIAVAGPDMDTPATHTQSQHTPPIHTFLTCTPSVHEILNNTDPTHSFDTHTSLTISPTLTDTIPTHTSLTISPTLTDTIPTDTPPLQTTCAPPNPEPRTEPPNRRRPAKRGAAALESKTAAFIALQAKQNEILETISKAMMLAAENDSRRLGFQHEMLKIKKAKLEEQKRTNQALEELVRNFKK